MMTKLRKIILIPALIIVSISSFFSCGVDRWPEYAHQVALDSWIYDIMQENYLWYEDMPSYDDVNLFQKPSDFLAKVKSKKDSYSFVDSIMDMALPEYGFDYSLVRSSDIDTAYNALITYVIPNSPAAEAGLKRGDWIMKVDTSYISKKYEVKLLQGVKAVDLVMGVWKKVPVEVEEGEEEQYVNKVVPNDVTLKMGVAKVLEDNPIHTYEVLTLTTGEKVGYLMYNSFIAGTKSDPTKYNEELLKVSNEFKAANIKGLILDFRYNKGGTIDCAQLLATMIAPQTLLNQTMAFLEYNIKNTNKDATLTYDSKLLSGGSNLNLQVISFITSGETAGAPEMVMHCLNSKVSAYTVGANTKGQNVGTERFINEEFLWSVNPVVCTIYNSEHDTQEGAFKATYPLSESSDYFKFLPFGDPNELLLSAAIGVLNGTYPPKDETNPTVRLKIEKTYNSPCSRRFVGGGGLQVK